MRNRLLIGILFVVAACGSPKSSESQVKDVSDAESMQVRPDGKYDVICKDGTYERVTFEQIRANNVCTTGPNPQSNIQSVQSREDGSFNVVCKDHTHTVATAEDIILNRVCVASTTPVPAWDSPLTPGAYHEDDNYCKYDVSTAFSAEANTWTVTHKTTAGGCSPTMTFVCHKDNAVCAGTGATSSLAIVVLTKASGCLVGSGVTSCTGLHKFLAGR